MKNTPRKWYYDNDTNEYLTSLMTKDIVIAPECSDILRMIAYMLSDRVSGYKYVANARQLYIAAIDFEWDSWFVGNQYSLRVDDNLVLRWFRGEQCLRTFELSDPLIDPNLVVDELVGFLKIEYVETT